MNYIKHLNQWLELVSIDDRITPNHISLYFSLFHQWNRYRFPQKMSISREELMQISKIGSSKTYYKCLHELDDYGYIQYFPSFNPLKGSRVTINELSDADVFSVPGEDEKKEDNDEDTPEEIHKKICLSCETTLVNLKHIEPSSCSKNDSSASQVVTPLLINNINLINYKQRERRAHTRDNLIYLKNYRENDCQGRKALSSGLPSDEGGKSRPASGSSSGVCLERKKIVPRDFLSPTLDEVKDFFTEQLTGNHMSSILGVDNRAFEAEKFFNHYESNGWLLGGKVPMRNWKASCRSWVAKIPYFTRFELKKKRSAYDRLHAKPVLNYASPL